MIGYLAGIVRKKRERSLILDVQGVGYDVMVPNTVLANIAVSDALELFIHTHVREDAISLFGFSNEEELTLFNQVIGVSGIGPKLGLEILSSPMAMVKRAIVEKDAAFLTKIPGIGKKTAERIILDLAGKIGYLETPLDSFGDAISQGDIVSALENLGYKRDSILLALRHKPEELTDEAEIVKYCLKMM